MPLWQDLFANLAMQAIVGFKLNTLFNSGETESSAIKKF
jgi:hypothetical protein